MMEVAWIAEVKWDADGLIPAVIQDWETHRVLMLGYMNRESLCLTCDTGRVHFWSRSRKTLWRKGETSGHVQQVREMRLDCDGDTVLVRVRQEVAACHTGHVSCFYRVLDGDRWMEDEPPVFEAQRVYGGGLPS
jgi:phosphoribosyl-AMP cyclohydrolase